MSSGILNQITFKRESVWGTPVVPDKLLPVRLEGGIVTDQDIQIMSALRGHLAKNYHAQEGNRVHEGDYLFDLFPDMIGYPMVSVMGDVVSTLVGGETIVYAHSFNEAETKPSFTIEQMVGENVRRYAGSVFQNVKISGKAGEPLEVSTSVKAKSQTSASPVTVSPSTVRPFDFATVRVEVDGTEFCEVENFEVEITSNLEMLHTICDHDPAFRYSTGHEVKGKLEMYLNTATLAHYTDYLAKTEREIAFRLTGEAIGVSSNYTLELEVLRAVFSSATTELSEDFNLLVVEFQALYDNNQEKLIEFVLRNLVPSYAA